MTGILRNFIVSVIFIVSAGTVKAQVGLCPPNLDFEQGDFSGWDCQAGYVDLAGNILVTPPGPLPNIHTIITSPTATDPYGGFPQLCPNGSGHSVRLGNNSGGHGAESISYTYTIPSTLTEFSMLFHYAVVLQNPDHQVFEQPRFRARIIDLSANLTIPCVNFDFTALTAPSGFLPSSVGADVVYKDWTPVTVNLNAYIGRTIKLEFITNDCVYQAHFGYAYLDVNTNCNGAVSGTTVCPGVGSLTLTAPFGFQSYNWYSDVSFTSLLTSTQALLLNPVPAVGTVFPVIVDPYPGFGCRDTLYATISVATNPVSFAGPDVTGCAGHPVQVGGANAVGYIYAWTPAHQVSNPISSNPFALAHPPNSSEFIVRTTDILTGCASNDTVIVSNNIVVDTVMTRSGPVTLCGGESPPSLSVNTSSTVIQWYEGTTRIPGAMLPVYHPTVPGNYWARVTQNGCTDSTSVVSITIHPLPLASFTAKNDTLCGTDNSFIFTNTSSSPDNSAMTYNWKFSDGNILPGTNVVKTFSVMGDHDAELVATTIYGCKDSSSMELYVVPTGIPDFSLDSICVGHPVLFRNLTNENGTVVSYTWNFNNGDPPFTLKDPPPVIYTTPGPVAVVLQTTSPGCESDPRTVTKNIQVHASPPGIRYPDITVPQGSSKFIHVRDIPGTYVWTPQQQLSSYTTRFTEFFATGNDVLYRMDITDKFGCVTTDTLLMQVLKKPGFYLPTAFTPNDDGLNDIARPYLVGMKSLKSFSIFNRWGDRIFRSTSSGEGWNGKYKGVAQDSGVYVWILEFYTNDNILVTEKGTITIIR